MYIEKHIGGSFMNAFLDSVNNFINSIPDVIMGIIYLVVAFVLATLVKNIVEKLLKKLGLAQKIAKITKAEEANTQLENQFVGIIGKVLFLVIFLLFLPTILAEFGLGQITSPITGLINTLIAYIPNVIACVLIVLVGLFIASIVRALVVAAISITKVEKVQAALGGKAFNISALIGNLLYIIIAIVTFICALNVLDIPAISAPATGLLSSFMNAIPAIVIALIVFFVGVFLANIVETFLLAILNTFGLDEKCNSWLANGKEDVKPINFTKLLTGILKAVIIVLFAVEAINTLNFAFLTSIAYAIIAYVPSVLVAIIAALVTFIVCRIIDAKVKIDAFPNAAKMIKAVIIIIASFIALSQLGIAPIIVNTAFVVAIIAAGVAFALAVGLGGRQFVQDKLAGIKCCCKKDEENK